MLSRIFKALVSVTGLVTLLFWSSDYFANRAVITSVYDDFYRYTAEAPVDVLIAGTSHSQCDINTLMLSERLGASVYTLGMPAQTIGLTRYALEDALRFTQPRVVLIDTYFIAHPEILEGREQFAYELMNAMKSSDVKMACISDLFQETRFFEASFPIISNHSGWKDPVLIHRNKLYQYEGAAIEKNRHYNGFTPQVSVMDHETFRKAEILTIDKLPPIPEKSWEYIRHIIALCRAADAEPVFIQLPLLESFNRNAGYENRAQELASGFNAMGVAFLDFNQPEIFSRLGLVPQDFLNEASDIGNYHLNIQGANKLTAVLADSLNSRWRTALDSGSHTVQKSPQQMLRLFQGLESEDLVFMAVSDDASTGWLPEETQLLRQMGLKLLPEGFWGHSYAAVFSGDRTVLLETRSPEKIDVSFTKGQVLSGIPLPAEVHLTSTGVSAGSPEAHIFLDGFDYSFSYRGLNIAVFNRKTGMVRSVEQFDLYDRSLYLDDLAAPSAGIR